jgi:hypothetical protein
MQDPYSTLNVPRSATREQVKAAYQRLARTLHPDKLPASADHEQAANLFGQIDSAWKVLGGEDERAVYDELGLKGMQALALVKADAGESGEALLHRVKHKMDQMDLVQDMKRFNVRGGIRADAVLQELRERGEFAFVAVQQSVDFPLSDADVLTLGGVAGSKRGEPVLGMVSLTHRRTSGRMSFEWTASLSNTGEPPALHLKAERALSALVGSEIEFRTDSADKAGLMLGVSRKLSPGVEASVSMGAGALDGVRLGLSANRSLPKWARVFEANLSLSRTGGGVEASYLQNVTPGTRLKGAVRLLTTSMDAELEASRMLSGMTNGGCAVSLGLGGVSLKLRVVRAGVRFDLPLLLTSEPSLEMFVMAGLVPLCAQFLFDRLMAPRKRRWAQAHRQKLERDVGEARAVARRQWQLMRPAAQLRRAEEEQATNGLVVLLARFGTKLSQALDWSAPEAENIDVTDHLQFFVREGRLHLQSCSSFGLLLGFYNPCLVDSGSPRLFVRYCMGGQDVFEIFFDDGQVVDLPSDKALRMGAKNNGVQWHL